MMDEIRIIRYSYLSILGLELIQMKLRNSIKTTMILFILLWVKKLLKFDNLHVMWKKTKFFFQKTHKNTCNVYNMIQEHRIHIFLESKILYRSQRVIKDLIFTWFPIILFLYQILPFTKFFFAKKVYFIILWYICIEFFFLFFHINFNNFENYNNIKQHFIHSREKREYTILK